MLKKQKNSDENLRELQIFFESMGFDGKTIEEHSARLARLILFSAIQKLNNLIVGKREPFPPIKSENDLLGYYERHLDMKIIKKVIMEESQRIYGEYFETIAKETSKI